MNVWISVLLLFLLPIFILNSPPSCYIMLSKIEIFLTTKSLGKKENFNSFHSREGKLRENLVSNFTRKNEWQIHCNACGKFASHFSGYVQRWKNISFLFHLFVLPFCLSCAIFSLYCFLIIYYTSVQSTILFYHFLLTLSFRFFVFLLNLNNITFLCL